MLDPGAASAVDFAWMNQIALVFFLGLWIVVVVRLLLTHSDRYRRAARLPLDESSVPDPRSPEPRKLEGAAHHG